jgi:peptidoglycan/xylan/chitin deacetylase (PgdA/CDA1 family)
MALLDLPGWPEKRKFVVITFDDGFQNFYTHAFPVLHKYGATATMFLPTSFIGDSPRKFMGHDCLTWGMVVELMRANITFGSHTVTHRPLWTLGETQLEDEIARSKQTIEDKTGQQVDTFAYPFAFPEANHRFKQKVKEILLNKGYKYAVSTIIGTAKRSDDRLVLKRLPVNSWDDAKLLRAKVEGGYDWLHLCQAASKILGNGAGNRD